MNLKLEGGYIRAYTMDWDNGESDSLHLEYSYDKEHWYSLNGGNGVLFPRLGSKQMKNPRLRREEDGSFLLLAEDAIDASLLMEFHSTNLTDYTAERLLKNSSITAVDHILGPNKPLQVSQEELQVLFNKWGRPEPVTPETQVSIEVSDSAKLPKEVLVPYSNGSYVKQKINWNLSYTKKLPSQGTFTLKGYFKEHQYSNPFIMHAADPFIYRHTDGSYYFTSSHADSEHDLEGKYQYRKITLRKAKTLEDLSNNYTEKVLFSREPLSNDTSPHIWAPELHFIDSKWYLYFTTTISNDNRWEIRPHVLECADEDPMTATWVNKGVLKCIDSSSMAFTRFSLDHTVFEHKGSLYMIWAQEDNKNSDLFISIMINPWTIDEKVTKIATPQYNWETHGFPVCEGPSILKRNGRIFLIYSASGTDALYCMGMITAEEDADLLKASSWVKTPYPVFQSNKNNGQFGPGHNSFTVDEDGNDIMVYHARQKERYLVDKGYQPLYDVGRNASLGKVYWNPDGTPNFSIPLPSSKATDIAHEITATFNIK
ncbi:MAG: family 43 glycosylhydrolase [Clostridiales bacterium]|nr:family 43 glycosylhydrolase [Clostridiales bacterium]